MSGESVTGAVCSFISSLKAEAIPPVVLDRAALHLLDTIGAIISGASLKPGRVITDFVRAEGSRGESTVLAGSLRTSPALAALGNGTMAHADETDDAHFSALIHPGACIVPAVLAVGESRHASGRDVVTAVVVGYDVMARLSKAIDGPHMKRRGFNGSGLCGSLGAAAAVANLLGLPETASRYALALAATQASGLAIWRLDHEHVQKALSFGGFPARNGVTAALMAAGGFTAPSDVFDGEYNFLGTFSRAPAPEQLTGDLGTRFELMGTSIKKYPAGQPLQATLDALLRIVGDERLTADHLADLTVRLPESAADTVNARSMADVNAQFLIAVALLDGGVDFPSSHDDARMESPEVRSLMSRIRLVADPELTRAWPARRMATVELRTMDGRTFSHTSETSPGSPENPLSADEVAAKFVGLVEGTMGRGSALRASEALLDVLHSADISEPIRLLGAHRGE